jgi:small ligand-binding sensory domain FIST
MRFVSLISQNESPAKAVEQIVRQTRESLEKIDVVFAFVTAHHAAAVDQIVEKLWLELDPQTLIGCTAEGVIGEDKEIEQGPGIAILAGHLPGVKLHPFHIAPEDWGALLEDHDALAQRMGHGPQTRAIVGVGDPFTTPVMPLVDMMSESMPAAPLIGGMASAAQSPGGNALFRNDEIFNEGMVGLSLSGAMQVQTIVSQGCRPIGRSLVITKAHDNVIEQLGGKPSLKVLSEIVNELPEEEKRLLHEHGLMIGRAISEYKDHLGRGDFLIRSLAGVDQRTGAIAVGDLVRVGQTVQFQARDGRTAHEDLDLMLKGGVSDPPAAGGLLFSCNGRGTRLFDDRNHDITAARAAMPRTPIAGFFAAGELGPVEGRNFIHGHTASFALLRPTEVPASPDGQ